MTKLRLSPDRTPLVVSADASTREVRSWKRARTYTHVPLAERFWQKVDKNGPVPPHCPELGPCWVWTGSNDNRGYGQIREAGKKGRLLKAHRVAWAIHNGALLPDVLVMHRCDNPPCVRGDHLAIGTSADNSQDAAAKGRLVFQQHPERAARGVDVAGSKLTAEKVAEIRQRYADGARQTALASEYGVTQANISEIVLNKTWRHV